MMLKKCFLITTCSVILCVAGSGFAQTFPNPVWPDGTFVRANDRPEVYQIQNGTKRWVVGQGCAAMPAANNLLLVWSYLVDQMPTGANIPCGQLLTISSDFRSAFAFAELPQDSARKIGMSVWTMTPESIRGVIRWEVDTTTNGVCGGALIGLIDARGNLLHYFTPPTGCLGSKPPGPAIQRFEEWSDTIPSNIRSKVAKVTVRIIFTDKPWQELLGSGANAVNTAVSLLGATGSAK